jgi:hypothetical protein
MDPVDRGTGGEPPHGAPRCLSCGHDLGIGRFCVNCGHPKDAPVDSTAERPAVRPIPPPPVHEPPRPARFPLFADETAAHGATTGSTGGSAADAGRPTALTPAAAPPAPSGHRRPRSAAPWWALGLVAAILLFGGGGVLLVTSSLGDDDTAGDPATAPVSTPSPSADESDESDEPSESPSPDDADDGDDGDDDEPVDLASRAEATPPDTAAPSRDVSGNAVRYEAFNMLDGQADTAWRMPGDASGREIVFRLDSPTTLVGVGLINGYAKVEPGYDGYAANRRIKAVEWVFADGTVVPQKLGDDLALQGVEVDRIETDTVTLRIVKVSEPGTGSAGRDYTAISDVALVGTTA